MLIPRVIPCLLISDRSLVKTTQFKSPSYVGDPINAVKIFNDKEVDELIILDIDASKKKKSPNFELIQELATECFMPLAYGGGISNLKDIEKLFAIGIEKVILNTVTFKNEALIKEAINIFGSQSIVVSIDVKRNWRGKNCVYVNSGKKNTKIDPVTYVSKMNEIGVGEIIINAIKKDGTFSGYDISLIKQLSEICTVPLVAIGGAGGMDDFKEAITVGRASAVSAGSFFIYQQPHRAVLITYPDREDLITLFSNK